LWFKIMAAALLSGSPLSILPNPLPPPLVMVSARLLYDAKRVAEPFEFSLEAGVLFRLRGSCAINATVILGAAVLALMFIGQAQRLAIVEWLAWKEGQDAPAVGAAPHTEYDNGRFACVLGDGHAEIGFWACGHDCSSSVIPVSV
jgi:hypothetical protein